MCSFTNVLSCFFLYFIKLTKKLRLVIKFPGDLWRVVAALSSALYNVFTFMLCY